MISQTFGSFLYSLIFFRLISRLEIILTNFHIVLYYFEYTYVLWLLFEARANLVCKIPRSFFFNNISLVAKKLCKLFYFWISYKFYICIYNFNFTDGVENNGLLVTGVPESFECPHHDNPQNGVVKCGGRLCLVKCDEGYRHGKNTAFVYRCVPKTGRWTTLPVGLKTPWPNCIPRMVSHAINS